MDIITVVSMIMFAISLMSAIDADRCKRHTRDYQADIYLTRGICFAVSGYVVLILNNLLL